MSTIKGLSYQNHATYIAITGYTGTDEAVTIPEIIENLPVMTIGDWAFADCSSLTSITIPPSVTRIGYEAFDGCGSLRLPGLADDT